MVKTIKFIQVIGMAFLAVLLIALWIIRAVGLFLTEGTESAMKYISVISSQIQENDTKPTDGNGANG